jgi:hypothetical protein
MRQSLPGKEVGGVVFSIVGNRYVETPNEYVEELARSVVKCKVCELVKRLIHVVTSCSSLINLLANINSVCSH